MNSTTTVARLGDSVRQELLGQFVHSVNVGYRYPIPLSFTALPTKIVLSRAGPECSDYLLQTSSGPRSERSLRW